MKQRMLNDVLDHNKNEVLCRCNHDLVFFVTDPYKVELVLGVQIPHNGFGHFYEVSIVHSIVLGGIYVHIGPQCESISICQHQGHNTRVALDSPKNLIDFCSTNRGLEILKV